jgi:hypothetical protein
MGPPSRVLSVNHNRGYNSPKGRTVPSNAKVVLQKLLPWTNYSIRRKNELTRLADLYGSDKGNQWPTHLYTRIYDKLFKDLRNNPICLLEIGLLRTDTDARRSANAAEGQYPLKASTAPSLAMWRSYFRNATLYGLDIDDFSSVKIDGCSILKGDAGSRESLQEVKRTIGRPIDILIDDASHVSHHQQLCFGVLFPSIAPGGMYIIEDLHWQDHRFEKKDAPKTRQLLRQLQLQRRFESPFLSEDEQQYIEKNTSTVLLFDSLSDDVVDASDALAIIVKRQVGQTSGRERESAALCQRQE